MSYIILDFRINSQTNRFIPGSSHPRWHTHTHARTHARAAPTDALSLVYCVCEITGQCGRLQNSSVCTWVRGGKESESTFSVEHSLLVCLESYSFSFIAVYKVGALGMQELCFERGDLLTYISLSPPFFLLATRMSLHAIHCGDSALSSWKLIRVICLWGMIYSFSVCLCGATAKQLLKTDVFAYQPLWSCRGKKSCLLTHWSDIAERAGWTFLRAAVNLQKSRHLLCIRVLDACSGKVTLHTQRTLYNCGAPSGAGRTEIKQVLHPILLKISLFRRGWWILDCVCEGNSVMSVRARTQLHAPLQMGHADRGPIKLFVHIPTRGNKYTLVQAISKQSFY